MKNFEVKIKASFGVLMLGVIAVLTSCSPASKNKPGHEYMMDMGHSIAYEANVINEFYYNRWDPEVYYKLSQPHMPVNGTVPRGMVALSQFADGNVPEKYEYTLEHESVNGAVPYYYKDTEGDRARASKEIVRNPYPITKAALANGKSNYDIYCGLCHGEKADGDGYLVRDGGKYPAQPANLLSDTFMLASNGRFYHAIMFGKNMMGGYADKLSYKERWEVIMYIRSLQAGSKGLKYDENVNTLNKTDFVMSANKVKQVEEVIKAEVHDPAMGHSETKKINVNKK